MFQSWLFLHNFIQSIDVKIEWHSLALFRATFCSYMDRRIIYLSRRVAHIQIAFYTDVSAVLLSRRIYILSYYETCARSREEDREDIHGRRGGSRVLIKGVRASGGISLLAGRGVVAFRRDRECTGMNGRGWGSPFARRGNPRGTRGRERNARIECVCALCAHAVLRCAWLETRTGYIYGSRLPGRWRHARGYLSAREATRNGVRQDNKTDEGELAVPEDSRCRLIRSTRR